MGPALERNIMSHSKKNVRVHSNTNRRKRRLRKNIREAIQICLIGVIGSVALAALFFGASIQEQDRLTVMAACEVSR